MTFSRSSALVGLAALTSVGCTDRDVTLPLRSLSLSGDVSYVCRNGFDGTPLPLSDCTRTSLENNTHDLFALVTQPSTGEVAVVNVPVDPRDPRSDEGVIDVDPSVPGYGFLRVGARPEDIVSTPRGEASFVSSRDPRKPGLFALPTSCLGPPNAEQAIRDLTTWSACSLPSVPGKMELVFERRPEAGREAGACPSTLEIPGETSPSNVGRDCPTRLVDAESGGRWKIVVALPEAGSVLVVDAQALLDASPGEFQACPIEASYPLTVDLPSEPVQQRLPPDLQACVTTPTPVREPPPAFTPRPSDLALADSVLYVADEQAPVIHRLDMTRPCAAAEMPPLLPASFDNPARTVTTSQLAVSPLTPGGKRFVYAVDRELPLSSVMMFDVSPGSTDRTPIVRPGSVDIPGDSPDRLRFASPVRDLVFIERDLPAFTGASVVGQACNPDPDALQPGSEYQPRLDLSDGAQTNELRGVFALVVLANGQLAIIDVEDLDAPCRRPVGTNQSSEPDFRGCANDPEIFRAGEVVYEYRKAGDVPTVTNEVSCRMVEPHRERSTFYGLISDVAGVRAPALQSFPQITLPDNELGRGPEQRPKLLAVDFSEREKAQVYIGSTLYSADTALQGVSASALDTNPSTAQQNSVALPFTEPRAYNGEPMFLTYEGALSRGSSAILDAEDGLTLTDPTGSLCQRGVQDVELMRELGVRRFGLQGQALEEFAREHVDSVWLTSDVLDEDDPYWRNVRECTRSQCEEIFGEYDPDEGSDRRKFPVLDANDDVITLNDPEARFTACCFPAGTKYEIHATQHWILAGAGGVQHDVIAQSVTLPSGATVRECVRDCNPKKRWSDPRVFEITTSALSRPGDPCVSASGGAVSLTESAARCVYSSPTARFAVYRGSLPTARNTRFDWAISGAFRPLGLDFASLSPAVSPTRLAPLPDLDWLTMVDSASLGLVTVELEDLQVLTPTIN